MTLIGVADVVPLYDLIRWIVFAQLRTGHIVLSPVDSCVTVSFFSSFFWNSNVIDTQSAFSKSLELCSISLLFLKKRKLRMHRSFVLLDSASLTFEYSHERIAKKIAPVSNVANAFSVSVDAVENPLLMTLIGNAFCCFSPGSSFL